MNLPTTTWLAILEGAIPAEDVPVHRLSCLDRYADDCHTSVTRDGELDACGKPSTAAITGWFEGEWITWPVCAYHAHMLGGRPYHHLVPLVDLVAHGAPPTGHRPPGGQSHHVR